MRPRIGITTSTLERAPDGPVCPSSAVYLAYAQCIYAAGGLPLLLPTLDDLADAAEMLAPLDGLLLSGGGDLDPRHWGETPHPKIGSIDPLRDDFELALVRAARARGLPLLGICRGMQVMAVAGGGALWQDLPAQTPGDVAHMQAAERHLATHRVTVAPASSLARIVQPDGGEPVTLNVNSFHHQAPKSCGTLFSAVAWSDDGIIEGLAAPADWFALGVQWHPETMTAHDPQHARLFSALVHAATPRTRYG